MSLYYLALGANLGDRARTLGLAVQQLALEPGVRLRRGSSVYETKPVGLVTQPDFLNLVVEIETELAPPALLARCLGIEARLGRVRGERWGPRLIDLDVLASPGVSWSDEQLTLPHPRMNERAFVLTPLAELAPDLLLGGETVQARALALDQSGLRHFAAWEELTAGFCA